MEAFVVDVEGSPPVFGRPWLELLNLDWKAINKVNIGPLAEISIKTKIDDMMTKYNDVTKPQVGTLKGVKAKITLQENATPKFMKARSVPYALRAKTSIVSYKKIS